MCVWVFQNEQYTDVEPFPLRFDVEVCMKHWFRFLVISVWLKSVSV